MGLQVFKVFSIVVKVIMVLEEVSDVLEDSELARLVLEARKTCLAHSFMSLMLQEVPDDFEEVLEVPVDVEVLCQCVLPVPSPSPRHPLPVPSPSPPRPLAVPSPSPPRPLAVPSPCVPVREGRGCSRQDVMIINMLETAAAAAKVNTLICRPAAVTGCCSFTCLSTCLSLDHLNHQNHQNKSHHFVKSYCLT